MIASWMLYASLLAGLLGTAAWAAERALRLWRLPGRWPWALAVLPSLVAPLAAWRLAAHRPTHGPGVEAGVSIGPIVGGAVVAYERTGSLLALLPAWLDTLLLGLWAAASLLLVLRFVDSWLRVRRELGRWTSTEVDGISVYLSDDCGPAVVGAFPGQIVLPRWIVERDRALRRLILRHEIEHIRHGDPLLLIAGWLASMAMPWNLALWWQTKRLRLAVELDCDARVLRRHPDVRRYAALLLTVARRRSSEWLASTAFSENRSALERRILMLSAPRPQRRVALAVALATVTLCAPTGVAALPLPERTVLPWRAEEAITPASAPEPARSFGPLSERALRGEVADTPVPPRTPPAGDAPVFTPFERAPELRNRAELAAALRRAYPAELRDAGIGGTVRVWMFIDEDGIVRDTRIAASSGHPLLDRAGESAVPEARFAPALNRGEAVPVWIQFPVSFQTPASTEQAAAQHSGRVSGLVTSGANGRPVPGARVTVVAGERGAVTAADGRFVLVNLRPGSYELQVEDDGHRPQLVRVQASAGETVNIEVTLRPMGDL